MSHAGEFYSLLSIRVLGVQRTLQSHSTMETGMSSTQALLPNDGYKVPTFNTKVTVDFVKEIVTILPSAEADFIFDFLRG